eukprot:TRINITY_DN20555_c0_g1_i1.p2 TRINITY_DN20555_c0_g1~~TRINITY_DN20555_c0_g1_i1.p2  ORF type:complete len:155 (+),score=21.23 TRINITY_DN20555_c0_g1_i1:84-548(+)
MLQFQCQKLVQNRNPGSLCRNNVILCSASSEEARIAVLGASGYTGADCVRLAALHPKLKITTLTAERHAGKDFSEVYPHLRFAGPENPKLIKIQDVNFGDIDAVFCCLPHATTQEIIAGLPEHVQIVDLSAIIAHVKYQNFINYRAIEAIIAYK